MDERRVAIIIEARNKAKAAMKDAGVDVEILQRRLQVAAKSLDQLKSKNIHIKTVMDDNLKQTVVNQLKNLGFSAQTAGNNAGSFFSKAFVGHIKYIGSVVQNMFIRMGSLALIAGVILGVKTMISDAAEIERQRAQLTALTHSAKEAGQMISWVKAEAKKTPFEVPGLIEMVSQLTSVGLDYKSWMRDLGDLAVQGGRDLEEGLQMATLAVVRLATGSAGEAFEQLRRLKISMRDLRMEGVKFTAAGELVSSPEQALEALQRVIRTKFGGSMKEMEQTAAVSFSNIKDYIREVFLWMAGVGSQGEILKGGFFEKVKNAVASSLEWFDKNANSIAAWSAKVGQTLASALTWIMDNKAVILSWGQAAWETFNNIIGFIADFVAALLGINPSVEKASGAITSFITILKRATAWLKDHAEMLAKVALAALGLKVFLTFLPMFMGVAKGILMMAEAWAVYSGVALTAKVAATGNVVAIGLALVASAGVMMWAGSQIDKVRANIEATSAELDKLKNKGVDLPGTGGKNKPETGGKNKPELPSFLKPLEMPKTAMDEAKEYLEGNKKWNDGLKKEYETSKQAYDLQEALRSRYKRGEDLWIKWLRAGKMERLKLAGDIVEAISGKTPLEKSTMIPNEVETFSRFKKYMRADKKFDNEIPAPPEPEYAKADLTQAEWADAHQKDLQVAWDKAYESATKVEEAHSKYRDALDKRNEAKGQGFGDREKSLNEDLKSQEKDLKDLRKKIAEYQKLYEGGSRLEELQTRELELETKALETRRKIRDLKIEEASLGIELVKWQIDYAKLVGSDAALSGWLTQEKARLTALLPLLKAAVDSVGYGSARWKQYATAYKEAAMEIAQIDKSQRETANSLAEAHVNASRAYVEMLKSAGLSPQAQGGAINALIAAYQDKLRVLEGDLADFRQKGRLIDVDNTLADIYTVRGEILKLQKDMRDQMNTDFDQMASKIINAPGSLQQILAKAGISIFQKQQEALQRMTSAQMPGLPGGVAGNQTPVNITVKAYLDGKALDAKVETVVDRRVNQFVPVGGF